MRILLDFGFGLKAIENDSEKDAGDFAPLTFC